MAFLASYIQNREPDPEQSNLPDAKPIPSQPKKPAIDFSMFGRILKKDGNFRLYLLARSISYIGNMSTAFIAVYAIKAFHLPDEQAAVFTGVILASGVLGYALWGAVGDRIGPKKIMVLSFICWFVALILAIISKSIWLYYLVFALFGLYQSGVGVGDSMLIMELGEESLRPTYLGMGRTLTGSFLCLPLCWQAHSSHDMTTRSCSSSQPFSLQSPPCLCPASRTSRGDNPAGNR